MNVSAVDAGFILTAIGLFMFLWREKRKFGRVNVIGVEQFKSFSGKMVATATDELLRWASLGMLFVGLFILAFA